jgi:microcystin degradation protein MlrC
MVFLVNMTRSEGVKPQRARVAALGLFHESNTFAPHRAAYRQFEEAGIYRGDEVVKAFAGSQATMGGYLLAAGQIGLEVVPVAFAHANPMGVVTRDAFERISEELVELLRREGPWDGVLLAQHGAAVAEGTHDADGEFIARVRATVGPEVPIGVTLDLHANVSERMVENATITILYRTNPHLDASERALECATLVAGTLAGEIRPVQALAKPPVLVNILRQATAAEPMRSLMAEVEHAHDTPGVLAVGLAEGYPYADVPEMGMSCLAVADGDAALAQRVAGELAASVWAAREQLQGTALSVRESVARACRANDGPVLLLDVGDNIGGGSAGDSTAILNEALRAGLRDYLETICDAAAAAACASTGVGGRLDLEVGGRLETGSPPCRVTGTVLALSDGRFEDPASLHGGFRAFNMGPTAAVLTDDGQTLVLTSLPVIDSSIERHRSLGLAPERMRAIVAKGVHSPVPAYGPVAKEMIFVDSPGSTRADLSSLPYRNCDRPLYPLDRDTKFA